jgi:tape measure domain-containing protein
MSVKAGTAYITVEMAGVAPLKKSIEDAVEGAAGTAATKASTALAKNMSGSMAAKKVVSDMASGLSRIGIALTAPLGNGLVSAVRSGAVVSAKEFVSGFSRGAAALFMGDTNTAQFIKSMGLLGARTGSEFLSSFGRGVKNIPVIFGTMLSGIISGFSQIGSGILTGLSQVPKVLSAISATMASLSRQIGIASSQAQSMGFIMLAAFTAPAAAIGILGAAIGVRFAVQIEDATVGLRALLPAGYDVEALVKRMQALAVKSPVFDTAGVLTFTQRMVAAGLEISKVERFLAAFGNIAVTVGIPMNKMNLALEAFAQMAGKGVVNMEELRQQLGDALPGALKIAAEGLGVTQAELFKMVAAGQVTADELLGAFIKVGESATYVQGAAAGADTLRSRWNQLVESVQTRLGTAVLENMTQVKDGLSSVNPVIDKLINSFAKSLPEALRILGQFADGINNLIAKYEALSDKNKELVKQVALILVAAGPGLLVLSSVGSAIAGVAAAAGVMLSPFGQVVIAIAAIAIGAKFLWDWLNKLWDSSKGFRDSISGIADAFKTFGPAFSGAFKMLEDSFGRLKGQFSEFADTTRWDALLVVLKFIGAALLIVIGIVISLVTAVISALGYIIEAIASLIFGVIKIVTGVMNLIMDLFKADWGKLAGDLEQIWDGLWEAVIGTIWNVILAIIALLWGFIKNIIDFFINLYDILVGHSIIPDLMNAIYEWFASLPGRVLAVIAGFVSSVIGFFMSLWSGTVSTVAGLVGDVVSYMSSLPGRIISVLSGLGSLLYGVGRDIISGLISGISDMAGALIGKVQSLAGLIRDTFSSDLHIGSPSKDMMKLGQFVVQGLVIGIAGEMDNLAYMISSSTNDAVRLAYAGAQSVITVQSGDGVRRQASLNIENYNAAPDDDPATQAEKWAFLNNTRGW